MTPDQTVQAVSKPPVSMPRPGPVIALLVVSAFVVILNETIMGVALPRLMLDLEITASTAQWLTTGFLLTMAVVIPCTGFLLARFSIRTLFFAAMTAFSIGTLIAAASPGFETLLFGRVVQAMGTAIMMPLLFTTVLNVVPADRRGRMMGVISIVIAVAPAVGPTIGGFILSVLDWRWMFWLVLPIALVAIALGAVWVRNITETTDAHFDILSVILSAFGFGGLVYGLSSIGEAATGHAPIPLWIPLAIGAVALAGFVLRQVLLQKTDAALLDLRTFASKSFRLAVVLVVVVMAAMFGALILLPLFLQQALLLDTLTVGLMLLPGGVLMGLIAPVVGSLFDRFGPRPLVLPGMVVTAVALWGMTSFGLDSPIWWIVSVHMLLNLGLGFVFTPLLTSALGSLPRALYSHGSATMSTIQQVAGAIGTALFVTLMSVGISDASLAGAGTAEASAQGVQGAFVVGAIIASAAVILALFVRKPQGAEERSLKAVAH